jgi:hypothetical protein
MNKLKTLEEVLETIENLEKTHHKLLRTITSTTLQQMVYSTELKLIDELLANMEISSQIHKDLSSFFRQKIKLNSQQVYKKMLDR